jgi:hypothetical protein
MDGLTVGSEGRTKESTALWRSAQDEDIDAGGWGQQAGPRGIRRLRFRLGLKRWRGTDARSRNGQGRGVRA